MEFWDFEMLKHIGFYLGRLVKINEHTEQLTQAKFTRICVEVDLTQPLKQGLWVEAKGKKVLVPFLYWKNYLCSATGVAVLGMKK